VLEHKGEFFKVRGPLNVAPSPQGEPVLVQAGASDDGRELAAATAEVIFGAQQTIAGAQEFYADVKGRMRRYGREPDELKIMPGLFPCIGRTEAEARAKFEALQDLIDPKVGLELLSRRLDYDLSGHDINGPLPDIPRTGLSSSRIDLFIEKARREKLTIRDLYRSIAGARGHCQIVGTPHEIADMMEHWVTSAACDGFNIMPPVFPHSLREFNTLVIPELQRRGLFRTAYEGTTLRANLGLKWPPWPSRAARAVARDPERPVPLPTASRG
jgi:FMN-dependent oxidoreductase (nitrilotriacetate monooxygenase family)